MIPINGKGNGHASVLEPVDEPAGRRLVGLPPGAAQALAERTALAIELAEALWFVLRQLEVFARSHGIAEVAHDAHEASVVLGEIPFPMVSRTPVDPEAVGS